MQEAGVSAAQGNSFQKEGGVSTGERHNNTDLYHSASHIVRVYCVVVKTEKEK